MGTSAKAIMSFIFIGLAVAAAALFYSNCTNPSAGTATETENVVVGTLLQPDGETPAAGVLVYIRPRTTLADTSGGLYKKSVDSAFIITDKNGTFAFDTSLDTGTYVVEAASGNNAVLIDSVVVASKDATDSLSPDMLKPTGAIKGIINLSQGGDPRKVFVLAYGINRFARVNEDGGFKFKGLAEAVYDVRLISSLDNYGVVDTVNVPVRSGDTTNLDTIKLPFTGIPAPSGLSVAYDTSHGYAILTWKPVAFSNLAGYIIYRNDTSSTTPVRLNERLVSDTVYRDSIFSNLMDTTNRVLVYRLKVQDKEANLSPIYSEPFTVSTPSPTTVRTFITWQLLNTLGDSASINDTVSLIASFTNATRKNIQVQWFVDDKDSLKRAFLDSALSGRDTMQLVWSAPAQHIIYSAITDNAKTVWWDSTRLSIVRDAPAADAGRDTTISINASLTLTGTATQKFGTIVIYKWDFDGDSAYDDSSAASAAMTHTYTHEAAYNAIFYIRDDDGNEATDSRKVTVTNRPPKITSIRPDTTISIKDSITLFATVTDIDGTIKEYAWDFTGDGTFEFTNTTQATAGFGYNTAGIYKAVLRVTDDDGKATRDTVTVMVLLDAPVVNAGKDTTVSINDTVRLHGSATQQFGTIVKWEWDVGNTGMFTPLNPPDTTFIAPSIENLNYQCVLRVTDDDGNVAKDTVKVSISQDKPIAIAGMDITVKRRDTVHLNGGGSTDLIGRICKYEWNIGNSGNFITCNDGSVSFIAPDTFNFNDYICILRVTDDDANQSLDTVKICIGKLILATNTAAYGLRYGYACLSFNNKMWLIDGAEGSGPKNDVWYSTDGANWIMATDSICDDPRWYHTATVFNNAIWITGGYINGWVDDVLYSNNGITWQRVTESAGLNPRQKHTSVTFNDKMWILGGEDDQNRYKNDVWYSNDGISWMQLSQDSSSFSPRCRHSSVVFNNKIWIIGGYDGKSAKNDVWFSSNGASWHQATSSAGFSPRLGHGSVVFENKIWVIGSSDIWYSNDGISWIKAVDSAAFYQELSESSLQSIVFDGKIWIIGSSDIWYLD
jgi:hypothetical protein